MNLYACVLVGDDKNISVPCGDRAYIKIDGRLSAQNALNVAIDHFTKTHPTTKHVAVYRAQSIGHRGKVVATFPYGRSAVYEPIVNIGCYK